jgi:hypothetical protein
MNSPAWRAPFFSPETPASGLAGGLPLSSAARAATADDEKGEDDDDTSSTLHSANDAG